MVSEAETKNLRNTLIGILFASLLANVGTWYFYNKGANEREEAALIAANKVTSDRIAELEQKLKSVEDTVVPISAAMQSLLIKQLTHFHTPIMDALLVKIGPPNTLTEAEEEELAVALKQRAQDMGEKIDASERDAALMLPMIMRRVRLEMRTDPKKQRLQTVSLPVSEAETK